MRTMRQAMMTALLAALGSGGARAGDLNPPGAPGPTMHTLEEIYQQLLTTQQQVAELAARLSSDGRHVTSGDMVLIPAGGFVMGVTTNAGHETSSDATPQHTVAVSAFYLDRHEVTSNLWSEVHAWATARGYAFGSAWRGKAADHPVYNVDWYDAIAWCNARSERDGFTPCYTNADGSTFVNAAAHGFTGGCNWAASGYRLPTEAEWEKAARGGVASRRFPWEDANTIQHARANYRAAPLSFAYDTSPTADYHPDYTNSPAPYTSPAGSFAPNAYGLYDMAGNACEWCWDRYSSTYYTNSPALDPRGPSSGTLRVIRGGSWAFSPSYARCASRDSVGPSSEFDDVGFRCARGL